MLNKVCKVHSGITEASERFRILHRPVEDKSTQCSKTKKVDKILSIDKTYILSMGMKQMR